MEVLDLKKRLAKLYKPSARLPVLVKVPPMRFLMIDGKGGIGGEGFQDAVKSLYGLAYPVKFAAKKQLGLVYPVMSLEGLYWSADGSENITLENRDSLSWRLMIMLPDAVPGELVERTREKVATKKDLPRLADVRVQTFSEGPSVQILHIGPYADETSSVKLLVAFAAEQGLEISGAHHEIYQSDPNKVDTTKLKTVLRYPVRKP